MLISSQADTFTLGSLLPSFFQLFVCHLNPALAFIFLPVELPLFCLSACYQSMSLSPFTFPPLSDVIPVFHFMPASCSSLINKQMTSPVCVFLFECQMTCTYPFLPTTGCLWVGFPLSFASRRHV